MNDVEPVAAPAAAGPVGPAPLSTTAAITTLGHLAWLAWAWGLVAIVFAVVLAVVALRGELDASLWEGLVASWQRWLVFGAGVSTIPVFAPLLVGNGVTRARLAASSAVALVAVALAGATFVTVGFAAEAAAFDAAGWPHRVADGDDLGGLAGVGRLFAAHALTFAAYFTSGWLVGLAYQRFGVPWFLPAIVPALAPVALTEALLGPGDAPLPVRALDAGWDLPFALAVVAATLVVAATTAVAGRLTREVELG